MDIPSDELSALSQAHAHHGRTAKSLIRQAWFNGDYSVLHSSIDSGALQRFRNSEHGGPSGLSKINLKKLIEPTRKKSLHMALTRNVPFGQK